jgi:4,4'-diaponeurosporenoate glycosyltransferase
MIVPALLCALGLLFGFLLIRRVPACPDGHPSTGSRLSIIIPARNEEQNLPRVLTSIAVAPIRSTDILVVDDGSTDKTASVAQEFGATVLTSAPLPAEWTGKTWACHQGARHAAGDVLLFLDADTYFVCGGIDRLLACWLGRQDGHLVKSLLPYHEMAAAYEQLSLFFNVIMAAGAGGFGGVAKPRLFSQSLLIGKDVYLAAGGHAAVRRVILENFRFVSVLRGSDAGLLCFGGKGILHMRMFTRG